ncbi:MAG: hypothetical protein WAV47_17995 [Blastocatellia bacterium]
MSVIAALISTRDGTVASDGRQFTSVWLHNNVPSEPPGIATDDFDKTFSLDGGKIVGAFCGLVKFSGATIAEHIRDITNGCFSKGATFGQVVERVEQQLTSRLNEINCSEVIPSYRNVDLVLAGGVQLARREMRIAAMRFCWLSDGVSPTKEIVAADKNNRFYVYGEDLAAGTAAKTFKDSQVSDRDADFLMRLTTEAVTAGIMNCGIDKNGIHPACGGRVFIRRTWY